MVICYRRPKRIFKPSLLLVVWHPTRGFDRSRFMNSSSASTSVTPSLKRQSEVDTRLHGRSLILARIVWIIMVVLSLTISLIDIPLHFARLHIVCVGSDCGQQLTAKIG